MGKVTKGRKQPNGHPDSRVLHFAPWGTIKRIYFTIFCNHSFGGMVSPLPETDYSELNRR